MMRPPPSSPLFPYTTFFRSGAREGGQAKGRGAARKAGAAPPPPPPAHEARAHQQPRHDARHEQRRNRCIGAEREQDHRSEEHTSELQSHLNLVCRLLLEKKKTTTDRSDLCTLVA